MFFFFFFFTAGNLESTRKCLGIYFDTPPDFESCVYFPKMEILVEGDYGEQISSYEVSLFNIVRAIDLA